MVMDKEVKKIKIEIKGKEIPLEKLPCNKCEWRYSIFALDASGIKMENLKFIKNLLGEN